MFRNLKFASMAVSSVLLIQLNVVCCFTGVAFFDKQTEYGLENEATLDD